MPDKKPNISSWSAAELMRYATGRMSAAEMHALEKAALEDAFLAEALEGYMEAMATQPATDVQAQANRLMPTAKKEEARVVSLWQRKSIRVAVAALFIVGAGWFIFSLLQKPAQPIPTVAQQEAIPQLQKDTGINATAPLASNEAAPQQSLADSTTQQLDLVVKNKEVARPVAPANTPAPGTMAMEQNNEPAKDFTVSAAPYSLQRANTGRRMDTSLPANADAMVMMEKREAKQAMRSMQVAPVHVFKGQITDAKNNPVPYANVMIDGQDFGTYSDVSGRFNFISEDSVLPIRVRSVGFTNQLLALKDGRPETKIVLQEDQQLGNSLPLTVQSKNRTARPAAKNITERDSLVGMQASTINIPYYDLYLLNNNRISPVPTLRREVELRFNVSKQGEATNITVVKSSGKALDNEAIRLLKEGPKLVGDSTSNSKKKVTVRF